MLRVYLDRLPVRTTQRTWVSATRLPARERAVERDSGCGGSGSGAQLHSGSQFAGLDRKLIKPADYERFAGRLAKIWLNEPVENQKFFEGRLAGYADGK